MSLTNWLAAGWLQRHKTSPAEIRDLWLIVGRDLHDAASGGISHDWQYGIAYNAALKLCTILLHAEGYKPAKGGMAHSRTLSALPFMPGCGAPRRRRLSGRLPAKAQLGRIRLRRRCVTDRCQGAHRLRPRTAHRSASMAAKESPRPRPGVRSDDACPMRLY